MTVATFETEAEAFELVNSSRFGLQAGIFTHDVQVAFRADATLDVGGVIVGDVPSHRADQMPYGGVKHPASAAKVCATRWRTSPMRVLVLTGLEL